MELWKHKSSQIKFSYRKYSRTWNFSNLKMWHCEFLNEMLQIYKFQSFGIKEFETRKIWKFEHAKVKKFESLEVWKF